MATRQDTLRVFLKVSTPHIALGSGSNKNKNKSSERIRNHPTERVQIIPFTQWRLRKMSDSWSHSHSYLLFPRNVFLKSFFQHQVITQTEGKLFRIFDRLSRPGIEFWLFFPSFTTLDNLKITFFFTYKFPLPSPHTTPILLNPLPITCTLPGKRSLGICPVAHVILFGSHSRRPVTELFGSLVWIKLPITTECEANFCLMRMFDRRSPYLKWTRPETPKKLTCWISWRKCLVKKKRV